MIHNNVHMKELNQLLKWGIHGILQKKEQMYLETDALGVCLGAGLLLARERM